MISIGKPGGELKSQVILPASKSISNRLLILQHHYGESLKIENLSRADDTILLASLLELVKQYQYNGSRGILHLDAHNAGTVFRFLTALLAITRGNFLLTGYNRMKERPIGPLVDALNSLGAGVEYVERVGFPPLFIKGRAISGGEVRIDSTLSSQFLSALLLIAPMLEKGLSIENIRPVTSGSYARMTIHILDNLGIRTIYDKNRIMVLPEAKLSGTIKVEPDWSAASFWYCMLALSIRGEIMFPGLFRTGSQGDERIAEIMGPFGVKTLENESGTLISNGGRGTIPDSIDFSDIPDLAMPVMLAMAAHGGRFTLTGLEKLRYKESDRLLAMERELGKIGLVLKQSSGDKWEIDGSLVPPCDLFVQDDDDHRIAMTFASLAIKNFRVFIEDGRVVSKSYPDFWNDMKNAGFELSDSC